MFTWQSWDRNELQNNYTRTYIGFNFKTYITLCFNGKMLECNTRLVYVHLWDFIILCSKTKCSKYKHVLSLRRENFLSSCRNLHDHGVPNSSLRSHSKSAVSPKQKFFASNHLVWTLQTPGLSIAKYICIGKQQSITSLLLRYKNFQSPQNIKNLSWNVKKFKLAVKRFLLMGSFYSLHEYFDWISRSDLGSFIQSFS